MQKNRRLLQTNSSYAVQTDYLSPSDAAPLARLLQPETSTHNDIACSPKTRAGSILLHKAIYS